MTDTGFAPVGSLSEKRRAHSVFLGHAAVFAIGATSSVQVANVTVTALSVVCLLLVPGWLLMTHRGADLVPLVLAALGWISFLASCLVNDVSVLWPNAVAPAAFGLYLDRADGAHRARGGFRSRPFWRASLPARSSSS